MACTNKYWLNTLVRLITFMLFILLSKEIFKIGSLIKNRMYFTLFRVHNTLNSHFLERSHPQLRRLRVGGGDGTWYTELLSEKNNTAHKRLVFPCITVKAALFLGPRLLIGPLENTLTWRQGCSYKRNICIVLYFYF